MTSIGLFRRVIVSVDHYTTANNTISNSRYQVTVTPTSDAPATLGLIELKFESSGGTLDCRDANSAGEPGEYNKTITVGSETVEIFIQPWYPEGGDVPRFLLTDSDSAGATLITLGFLNADLSTQVATDLTT
jgi:hypothetical protein